VIESLAKSGGWFQSLGAEQTTSASEDERPFSFHFKPFQASISNMEDKNQNCTFN